MKVTRGFRPSEHTAMIIDVKKRFLRFLFLPRFFYIF